jgi:hypothetical protein
VGTVKQICNGKEAKEEVVDGMRLKEFSEMSLFHVFLSVVFTRTFAVTMLKAVFERLHVCTLVILLSVCLPCRRNHFKGHLHRHVSMCLHALYLHGAQ